MIRPTIVGLVISVGFLGVILVAVRRRVLSEQLALLWVGVGVVTVAFAASLPWSLPDHLAHVLGFHYGSDLLLVGAVVFLLLLCFSLSVAVARLSARTVRLTQELAMLRLEGELAQRGDEPPAPPPGQPVAAAQSSPRARRR